MFGLKRILCENYHPNNTTMTSNKQQEIDGYIRRSIPDIARKCGVMQDDVARVMYNISSKLIFDGQ